MALIVDSWKRHTPGVECAHIVEKDIHPEGVDGTKVRISPHAKLELDSLQCHIISVIRGPVYLALTSSDGKLAQPARLCLEANVHVYLPPYFGGVLEVSDETDDSNGEVFLISAPAEQASGQGIIIRDELFLAACVTDDTPLRWILTSQYLSRRVFLHHDKTMLSKNGNPVSLFHTTMFDTRGLPVNDEGDPVFRMSYNSRTEFNCAYDVTAKARVRFALHPYVSDGPNGDDGQQWSEWKRLGSNRTYSLVEPPGGKEEEVFELDGEMHTLRNKHQVYSENGYVSHHCLFDPAPVGIEQHQPGAYSDYEPYERVTARPEYQKFRAEIDRFDRMLNVLSLARANGKLDALKGSNEYSLYESGLAAALRRECELTASLSADRLEAVRPWMSYGI